MHTIPWPTIIPKCHQLQKLTGLAKLKEKSRVLEGEQRKGQGFNDDGTQSDASSGLSDGNFGINAVPTILSTHEGQHIRLLIHLVATTLSQLPRTLVQTFRTLKTSTMAISEVSMNA